jgi:hypothetical protein
MNASRELQKDGVANTEFYKGPDPAGLIKKNGAASVSVTAGFSTSYGSTRCSVTVTLQCDQDAESINTAYMAAFEMAHVMAVDGMVKLEQDGQFFNQYGRT